MKELNIYFTEKGGTIYLVNNAEAIKFLNGSIETDFVSSLHKINEKGLFASLVECCSKNKLGFDITSDAELDEETFLHGKTKYVAVVSVSSEQEDDFVDYMFSNKVELTLLGHVTKGELRVDERSFGYIKDFVK